MRNSILISFFLCSICFSFLYSGEYKGTTPALQSFTAHMQLKSESIFKHLRWRCGGPQFQGGRISSIAGHPQNPFIIYVSAGSGNLWKTINNGTTWEPVFEQEASTSIGDVTVAPSDRCNAVTRSRSTSTPSTPRFIISLPPHPR